MRRAPPSRIDSDGGSRRGPADAAAAAPRSARRSLAASRVPVLVLLMAAALAGCEMGWGGASVELEDPAPPDTAGESESAEGEAVPVPDLPSGPLLYVSTVDADGRARAAPAARLSGGRLQALGWPDDPPDVYMDRFDSAFQRPGTELPLLAYGGRAGSLIVGTGRTPVGGGCPPVVRGEALLPPDQGAPRFGFWLSPGDTALSGGLARGPTSTTSRIRTFAPILAERLLGGAGVEQSFLAQLADLRAVAMPGDTAPGMAATFLVRDSLAAVPPPSGTSTSLFFLARFDRSQGYVPVWTRIRRYDDPAGKEVLAHLGWMPSGDGPLHLVRRVTVDGTRVAAFRVDGGGADGELAWVEPEGCPALEALERPEAEPAPAPASGS